MPRHPENLPEQVEENPPTLEGPEYLWPEVTPDELLAWLEETAAHRPVDFHGRTVCACGDFNCASLVDPLSPRGGDAA